jgi:hypothetical protein
MPSGIYDRSKSPRKKQPQTKEEYSLVINGDTIYDGYASIDSILNDLNEGTIPIGKDAAIKICKTIHLVNKTRYELKE